MSQLTYKSKFYEFKNCFHEEVNCLNFINNCELYAGIVKKKCHSFHQNKLETR